MVIKLFFAFILACACCSCASVTDMQERSNQAQAQATQELQKHATKFVLIKDTIFSTDTIINHKSIMQIDSVLLYKRDSVCIRDTIRIVTQQERAPYIAQNEQTLHKIHLSGWLAFGLLVCVLLIYKLSK